MKKILIVLLLALSFVSCKEKEEQGTFTVSGDIKNAEDQRIFLEQIFFSQQNPQVLDTAQLSGGKFSLSAVAPEEGFYRLRLEKTPGAYVFINDQSKITMIADFKDQSLQSATFRTPGNTTFRNFLINLESRRKLLMETAQKLEGLKTTMNNDSMVALETKRLTDLNTEYKNFIAKTVDTVASPNIAMFAVGNMDMEMLKTAIPNLSRRFPQHQGVLGLAAQYNQALTQQNQPQAPATNNSRPSVGMQAPAFTMADTAGKPVSLSSFKGKYVLVDFWASWCGPCRRENPNVVAAYNKFKNKNFTILGVSLDENKQAWLKAIKDDKLTWSQVSDLQGWNNATVALYGYEGIPYNVLLDPKGKIIATELRDAALEQKLMEVLK